MAILKILWPFVWEVLLGKQTVFQAIRTNKKRLILFLMVIGMIFTTSWSMMRLVTLGRAYLNLQHQCVSVYGKNDKQVKNKKEPPPAVFVDQPVTSDDHVVDPDVALKSQLLNAMRSQTHTH